MSNWEVLANEDYCTTELGAVHFAPSAMSDYQQSRVSSVGWPWQRSVLVTAANGRSTRREALIQVAIMWAIALAIFAFIPHMAYVVFGLSLFIFVTGFWFPSLFRMIRTGFQRFGVFVGMLLTWLLLVPFFYLAFFPARIVLLLKRKDPMNRAFPSPKKSMWIPHKCRETLDRYERQF